MAQRRPGGDASAEKRRRAAEFYAFRNLEDEFVSYDDLIRIAAVGRHAVAAVDAVVGVGRTFFAILLQPAQAGFAVLAGIDHAADADRVSRLESGDLRPDVGNSADDLMAGDHRVAGSAPVIADVVDVGMAYAAEKDLDDNVVGARIATTKAPRRQPVLRRMRGVTQSLRDHGASSSNCGSSSGRSCNRRLRPKDACEDRPSRKVDQNICTSSRPGSESTQGACASRIVTRLDLMSPLNSTSPDAWRADRRSDPAPHYVRDHRCI